MVAINWLDLQSSCGRLRQFGLQTRSSTRAVNHMSCTFTLLCSTDSNTVILWPFWKGQCWYSSYIVQWHCTYQKHTSQVQTIWRHRYLPTLARKEANKDDDCSSTLTVMVVMMPRVCGAPAMMGGSLGAASLHWNAALPHCQREACWREETSNLPPNTWSKWNWCNLELLDTNIKSLGAVETNKKTRHWKELS